MKTKPLNGHRCEGARVMYHVNCECGWSSGNFGSRRDAYHEWREHVSRHAEDGKSENNKGGSPC